MRLWHFELIPILPRQQLLGQHWKVCGLRGLAWGRKHSAVNYVFARSWEYLFHYHTLVMKEMKARGYRPNPIWNDYYYRGKRALTLNPEWIAKTNSKPIYPEHNNEYLKICLRLLKKKIEAAPSGRYDENEVYQIYSYEL